MTDVSATCLLSMLASTIHMLLTTLEYSKTNQWMVIVFFILGVGIWQLFAALWRLFIAKEIHPEPSKLTYLGLTLLTSGLLAFPASFVACLLDYPHLVRMLLTFLAVPSTVGLVLWLRDTRKKDSVIREQMGRLYG